MPKSTLPTTELLIEGIVAHLGRTDVTTADIRAYAEDCGFNFATINRRLSNFRVARGHFNLDVAAKAAELEHTVELETAQPVQTIHRELESLVPAEDALFVPFGNFRDVKSIIKSKVFYPLFITGLSGNGKTHSVEQACAQLKRDLVRVNLTIETDQDDLIGGFRLVNGETVWHNGPVIEAMLRGAVLLLDEIDLAGSKIMCLQSILEGKGYFIKKTGQWIHPAPGFNIVATANTKGRGSDSGKFIGTNVMNEAFLERFAVTFEQAYPTPSIETKILTRTFATLGYHAPDKLINDLVTWADIIRKTYNDGGVDDVISTRRLLNVAKAISIWGDVDKAITLSTNRFDDDTSHTFRELFTKISGEEPSVPSEGASEGDAVDSVGMTA